MMELVEVGKRFGEKTVLHGLNLRIPEGIRLCLIGPSGSGKSLISRLLIGLEQPDSGDVRFQGRSISAFRPSQLQEMLDQFGVVFQGNALFDSLTVRENVGIKLDEQRSLSKPEIGQAVLEALEQVGLGAEVLTRFPGELSGGMRKRVGIARAIVHRPAYLLYDEPTAGLDPANADRIDELILSLSQHGNRTSVIITHDLQSVRRLADRVVFLQQGQILFEGGLSAFLACRHPDIRAFLHRGSEAG